MSAVQTLDLVEMLARPDELLEAAARRLVNVSHNRRSNPRHTLTQPCVIHPQQTEGALAQQPILGVTTDISTSGIGFLTHQSITATQVVVEIHKDEEETLRVAAEIVRTGTINGYYRTGAKMLYKVE